ncbi:methyltransferase domain-containing protein [Mycolicibacterium flavescens]|uniref:class I SAM-dependent methyltransferase n=1 Tax=Mycolicibacterium flavescens TaxID=1776 RepID=UPI0013F4C75D|nr:class I SAM-dependent methyltransferase [Mycolicibacterium flavescens]MCV7282572.1 methyltransferase domain-containing protein [Mycolicibacterium flavescens]
MGVPLTNPVTTNCRACGAGPIERILDLGEQPISTHFPEPTAPQDDTWPLRVGVCPACLLLQLERTGAPEEADDTALLGLAAQSKSLDTYARQSVRHLRDTLGLSADSRIVELGSHGNHLRAAFAELGLATTIVEPDADIAARMGGVAADVIAWRPGDPLGSRTSVLCGADLVVDDFLLAHLDDVDSAIEGLAGLLAAEGTLALTVDHALPVLTGVQLDALRHGHHAVFSLLALEPLLARHGLTVVDAELLPMYGGSLRVLAQPSTVARRPRPDVARIRYAERAAGLHRLDAYRHFGKSSADAAVALHRHVTASRAAGRVVVGYGAPSRAATLLTAAGIGPDLLPFTVDRAPAKHGRTIPGTRVPICAPDAITATRPDEIVLLAWPMAEEIVASLPEVQTWGGRFVIPLPSPSVIETDPSPDRHASPQLRCPRDARR